MQTSVLNSHYLVVYLLLITVFLIYKDKSFEVRVRIKFYLTMLAASVLTLFDGDLPITQVIPIDSTLMGDVCKAILCPLLTVIWISIFLHGRKKILMRSLWVLQGVNTILCLTSVWTGLYFTVLEDGTFIRKMGVVIPYAWMVVLLVVFMGLALWHSEISDSIEQLIVLLILMAIAVAAYLEYNYDGVHLMDNAFAVGACVYYYYMIMLMYKRDALTHLMNRHNMNYDLEEMRAKSYHLSMIDVDNFKNINDKYGHQKGDEVLVTVVQVMKKNLLRGCRLYRYGGDEFAVLSKGSSTVQLFAMFDEINRQLEEDNLRISYGTARHLPGEHEMETIEEADRRMYEKKRILKSQDIWDATTGLYNLRGFLDEVNLLKKQALVEMRNICMVSLDIEHLGNINKAYGYTEGNLVITTLAGLIQDCLDEKEFAGRVGGDEFIVAFTTIGQDEQPIVQFKEKLSLAVKNCPAFDNKEYTVELNFASRVDELTADMSMEQMVNALLQTKLAQKENRRKANNFALDNREISEVDKESEQIALSVIDSNGLNYALQPIVSAKSGEIVAYEALMRADSKYSLSPLTLLRHAENNNRMYDIERLTFTNVMERLAKDKSIKADTKIFLNSIPGYLLKDEDYKVLYEKYGEWMNRIVVEITEQSEMDDESLALLKSRQQAAGFEIAIDDFGSGSSNTYSLLKYEPEVIKLDRLLVADIDKNTKKQYFVNSIITFAKENGIRVLAEGVETMEELKMVIRLQVDYIQGFLTASPSYVAVGKIDDNISKAIVSENIRGVTEGKRKIYVASTVKELSLVQLALQEYTGVTVSNDVLRIVGNDDYTADMHIKIKDGMDCTLVLKDVRLNSVDDLPCIELGKGSKLQLKIEGNCYLNQKGIYVPEGATLEFGGHGDTYIDAKGHSCYGIGCSEDEAVGNILLRHSSKLVIKVDGDNAIALGGGKYSTGTGIGVVSGSLDISVATVNGIGIGCREGDIPIRIQNVMLNMEFRVNTGTGIGTLQGMQDILFQNSTIIMKGSGSKYAAVGSNGASGGMIRMEEAGLIATFTGQEVNLVGVDSGALKIVTRNAKFHLKGEGDRILGLGSVDETSVLVMDKTDMDITINSSHPFCFGAKEADIKKENCPESLHINQ